MSYGLEKSKICWNFFSTQVIILWPLEGILKVGTKSEGVVSSCDISGILTHIQCCKKKCYLSNYLCAVFNKCRLLSVFFISLKNVVFYQSPYFFNKCRLLFSLLISAPGLLLARGRVHFGWTMHGYWNNAVTGTMQFMQFRCILV